MGLFCKHNWKILSGEIPPSKFEVAINTLQSSGADKGRVPHQMCDASRKLIQVVTCTKCGKLKRFVTDI
jgi:hypothetical protein